MEMVSAVGDSSVVDWTGTRMGIVPITLGDALCPAGTGNMEDKRRFLSLGWDLPAGLNVSVRLVDKPRALPPFAPTTITPRLGFSGPVKS